MEKKRNPEVYLKLANQLEQSQKRGKLKIYLGAAPGVGKTYEMLSDALALRSQGIDVVIGAIVTHGRQDIEALYQGFEKIPLFPVEQAGHRFYTLDIEGILRRSPALVLVDEAAFSNPEGLSHAKRWQDILALIDKGIDVYTTLNVQHLESLNDVVADLIQAPVYETVPDLFLEQADTIELVDLPSQELIKRLKQGKVYLSEDVARSQANFFQKNKLEVLREFAFRVAAQKLEQSTDSNNETQLINQNGGILIYLQDSSQMSELLRAAKRLSMVLRCNWFVLYQPQTQKNRVQDLAEQLQLAESLGAKTQVIFSSDVTKSIQSFINEQQISLWMLPDYKRRWWKPTQVLEKLAQNIQNVGVYHFSARKISNSRWRVFSSHQLMGLTAILIILFIFSQSKLDYWCLALMMALGLGFYYFFRRYRWLLSSHQDQAFLLRFLQNSASIQGQIEVLQHAINYLSQQFSYPIRLYSQEKQSIYRLFPDNMGRHLADKERAIVQWVFHQGKPAGPGSSHLVHADAWYFPIQANRGCLAVLALELPPKTRLPTRDLQNLSIFLHHLALILERESTTQYEQVAVLEDFQNHLRDQLLLGLGQQLYQPLRELIELLPQELAGHSCKPLLQRLSSHLQVMNYFNQPNLVDGMSEQSIEDLILNVLQSKSSSWAKRPIHWLVEENLPKVKVHLDLMRVVIENFLDNIDQHANADDGIDISLHLHRDGLLVSFADLGPGFPDSELIKIFDYFYQVKTSHLTAGLGLGLALCERIITWHQGRIWAENRQPHGAIFNFVLPLAKPVINGQYNEPNA
jgi:two-component system sensor histidine kinase KdpD